MMKHVAQVSKMMPLQAEASEKFLIKTFQLAEGKDPLYKEPRVPDEDEDPSGL
ncbi:MAG: hypothetical protein ACLFV4_12720 [Candidatus Hydrogenedentota bacterium]